MGDSTSKKILDSALAALLKGLELTPWVKVPATFVSELSARFKSIPEPERKSVLTATKGELRAALTDGVLVVKEPDQAAECVYVQIRQFVHNHLRGMSDSGMTDLVAAIPGATRRVRRQATVLDKAADLMDWSEATDGPGLYEVAKRLPGF